MATRDAKKFARSAQLNRTYYYVVQYDWVIGRMTLLEELVFRKRHWLDNEPMAGTNSASWCWDHRGPLTDNRDARGFKGLQTLTEFSEEWWKYGERFEQGGGMDRLARQVAKDTGYKLAKR